MAKKLTAFLSVILILALSLTFAACGDKDDSSAKDEPKSAAVGDTFEHSGMKLELIAIDEGADSSVFSSLADPKGKWITLSFKVVEAKDNISVPIEGFSVNGVPSSDARMKIEADENGTAQILKEIFDVDKDTDLTKLDLKVGG